MVPKLVVEFIGTFFLVFTVGMTVKGPDGAGAGRAGDRVIADGDGVCRRPFFRWPLQSGGDSGSDVAGQGNLGGGDSLLGGSVRGGGCRGFAGGVHQDQRRSRSRLPRPVRLSI